MCKEGFWNGNFFLTGPFVGGNVLLYRGLWERWAFLFYQKTLFIEVSERYLKKLWKWWSVWVPGEVSFMETLKDIWSRSLERQASLWIEVQANLEWGLCYWGQWRRSTSLKTNISENKYLSLYLPPSRIIQIGKWSLWKQERLPIGHRLGNWRWAHFPGNFRDRWRKALEKSVAVYQSSWGRSHLLVTMKDMQKSLRSNSVTLQQR